MSSLMQFNGKCDRQGVHLQFYKVTPSEKFMEYWPWNGGLGPPTRNYYLRDSETCGDPCDTITTPDGKTLPRIWICPRKPKGMFGCWVVFRYNGKDHVPDLSLPIATFRLPKDAKPLSDEDTIKIWKS